MHRKIIFNVIFIHFIHTIFFLRWWYYRSIPLLSYFIRQLPLYFPSSVIKNLPGEILPVTWKKDVSFGFYNTTCIWMLVVWSSPSNKFLSKCTTNFKSSPAHLLLTEAFFFFMVSIQNEWLWSHGCFKSSKECYSWLSFCQECQSGCWQCVS